MLVNLLELSILLLTEKENGVSFVSVHKEVVFFLCSVSIYLNRLVV